MKIRLLFVTLVLVSNSLESVADPPAQVDEEHVVWDFGNEAKGTPIEIARKFNRPLEEAYGVCEERTRDTLAKGAELKSASISALKPMHESTAYKSKLAEEKLAESDLDAARANADQRAVSAAFDQINRDKTDLAKMDAQFLDANPEIVQPEAAVQDCDKRYADSQAAMMKTALWRGRLAYYIKGWPAPGVARACS